MRRVLVTVILVICLCGCKQRRNDTKTSDEQIVVSTVTNGARRDVRSERFGELHVFVPTGPIKTGLVWFSANNWTDQLSSKADELSKEGVFVIGVDTGSYTKSILAEEEDCAYLAGEIERLIQSVEKGTGIPGYVPAALTGEGSGAILAKNIFFQNPLSFFGLISTTEEASIEGLNLCEPDDDEEDSREGFSKQIKDISVEQLNAVGIKTLLSEIPRISGNVVAADLPLGVADLPLDVILPDDQEQKLGGDTFAIFLSGDGGWATIDIELSERLVQKNIPVIGLSSLQYFWKKQTPQQGAKDLERIIHVYSGLFKRPKVALFGFSFGADVLPAFVSNLSSEVRAQVSHVVLLSPGLLTDYEIHISGWVGFDEVEGGDEILPMVRKLSMPVLCLYGESEKEETICSVQKDGVKQRNFISTEFPGDHHFDGEYDKVAAEFLKFLE